MPEHVLPGYEATPEGQYAFLKDVIEIVQNTPSEKGWGLVYWAPEHIAVPGVGSPWENMTLFDENGAGLPGLGAFKEASQAINVGVHDLPNPSQSEFTFFPVPFGAVLYLKTEVSSPSILAFKLYSVLGEEISTHSMQVSPGTQTLALDLPDIPPGLYAYSGYLGDQYVSGTLVKVRE